MYSLDEPAGQLYCGSHTTLGLSSAMDSLVKKVEEDMKISHFTSKFMVALDVSSKNSSVAGLGLDILLKLVAPEYSHKQWNYYSEFTLHLQSRDIQSPLFAYKDQRFGCLCEHKEIILEGVAFLVKSHLSFFLRLCHLYANG